jgi:uncharacterized protein YdhG (YjbR/CyaY superfamily)
MDSGYTAIDEYITGFPEDIQEKLRALRGAIRKAAPEATEAIRYGIPTFRLNGNLVHFAASKNHIGFYPTPSGISRFQKELSAYSTGKGTVRFPLDRPVPYELVERIVRFRVQESTGPK